MVDKICGVYAITFKDTGEQYIGSSEDCEKRWNAHRRSLKAGEHYSRLQEVYDTFGFDALEFSVLEIVPIGDDLTAAEQRHIDASQPAFNQRTKAVRIKSGPRDNIRDSVVLTVFDEKERYFNGRLTAGYLGVSREKLIRLVGEGKLTTTIWALDHRQRFYKASEIRGLLESAYREIPDELKEDSVHPKSTGRVK